MSDSELITERSVAERRKNFCTCESFAMSPGKNGDRFENRSPELARVVACGDLGGGLGGGRRVGRVGGVIRQQRFRHAVKVEFVLGLAGVKGLGVAGVFPALEDRSVQALLGGGHLGELQATTNSEGLPSPRFWSAG